MRKASPRLPEQGTQTPSPAPDLIPAETKNQPRTHIGIGTANGGTSTASTPNFCKNFSVTFIMLAPKKIGPRCFAGAVLLLTTSETRSYPLKWPSGVLSVVVCDSRQNVAQFKGAMRLAMNRLLPLLFFAIATLPAYAADSRNPSLSGPAATKSSPRWFSPH